MPEPDHRIIPTGIPFAQIPHDCTTDPDVSNAAFRVYAFLMKLANSHGRAWPGHRYIAEHLPMSRPTVAKAIDTLEATGWIEVNRDYQAHTYIVHGQLPARLPLDYTNRSRNLTGQETSPVKKVDQTGQDSLPEPVKKVDHIDNQDKQPVTNNQLGRRDLLWESFVAVHGEPASKGERGKYNTAVAKLRACDVSPEEYPLLVQAYTTKHGGLQPAPLTIASDRVGEMRHFIARGPIKAVRAGKMESSQVKRMIEGGR